MVLSFFHLLSRIFKALMPAGRTIDDDSDESTVSSDGNVAVMPIDDAIDLHTFAPRDIPSVVEDYLTEAQRVGYREVRLIHGRGKGVQRRIIQQLLPRHPAVEAFRDAPASRGGWGATVVWLKPRQKQGHSEA